MTIINVKDIPGKVSLPSKGTEKSAGYDIIAAEDPIVVGEIGRELTLEDGVKIPLYKNIQYLEYLILVMRGDLHYGLLHHWRDCDACP